MTEDALISGAFLHTPHRNSFSIKFLYVLKKCEYYIVNHSWPDII